MTGQRITPGGRAEVGLFAWAFARISGRVTGTKPPKLFLTMARRPRLFRGWLRFAARLMPGGTLPRRDTELVILRVAHVRECAYEFEHHRRLGARAGVGAGDLRRIQAGPDDPGLTPRERALLNAVDVLLAQRDLDDDSWADLRAHLDEPSAIEFLLLVGHYDMLATFLNTLRITPDEPR
ncbi:carboxymuconolactone decarboxylase family protein [Amycolatopsis sp. YIM 10]|uniref:carboxymuconolactone decarboxylase family protein n=1 Tax=Amycolatopsis sp. YIM 10 TaxID=2653857 RepID=UPI00128FE7B8|nr:carboxymuconolactone decarboxylase family protein [Amycolatopsis sp. YIM 10]QFU88560.1 Carboxymuconolactone decarboxylase family protein [Amycolatopsis sp. YIM 10]